MGELTGAKLRRGAGGRFTLRVPGFAGLDTSCAGSIDPRYAAYASGADTTDGTLRPFGAWEQSKDPLSAPIGTAAVLHRRHYTADEERDVLIAASGGQLFWGLPDEAAWHLVPLPPELNADSYQSDRWSCVTYEINPEGSGAPVDVLLMSSAEDGMICVRGDRMTASLVETPARFGVIARYAERVWGGGITGEPDTLYYSAPYDPLNWAQNDEIPEDGAGEVRQPSWDGDGFTALIPFAGQLIAFKRHSVWRVMGTDPGSYVFTEQDGGGTPAPGSVSAFGSLLLLTDGQSVCAYDGAAVRPTAEAKLRGVFARLNGAAAAKACSCAYHGRWYLALPLDGAQVPNAVLVYDGSGGQWLLWEDVSVGAFLPTERGLFAVSAEKPGRLLCRSGTVAGALVWRSGWTDLGAPDRRKTRLRVCLAPEAEAARELALTLETEYGAQTKRISVAPRGGRGSLPVYVPFALSGSRFRLTLEASPGAAWRLPGGWTVSGELLTL